MKMPGTNERPRRPSPAPAKNLCLSASGLFAMMWTAREVDLCLISVPTCGDFGKRRGFRRTRLRKSSPFRARPFQAGSAATPIPTLTCWCASATCSQRIRTSCFIRIKSAGGGVSRLVDDDFFGKLTVVIWIVGILLRLSAGSQGYASGVNTLSWHFVFSDALRCWVPAFLTGMVFLGLQKIIDLLKERGE